MTISTPGGPSKACSFTAQDLRIELSLTGVDMARNEVDMSHSRSMSTHSVGSAGLGQLIRATDGAGAQIISNPPNAEFEIWFVHGLTGNRIDTWRHAGGNFWPLQLLAEDFPQARIITYGYSVDIPRFVSDWKNQSSDSMERYGHSLAYAIQASRQDPKHGIITCPIYFVPHSFGGLVVEQALLLCAGVNSALRSVTDATAGILFMGTPHSDAHLKVWGQALRKLIKIEYNGTIRDEVLRDLKRDSTVLMDLEQNFQQETRRGPLKHIKHFYFHETNRLPQTKVLIVPQPSAVLKDTSRRAINANHLDMVRFKGAKDQGYSGFKKQLMSWVSPDTEVSKDSKKKKGQTRMSAKISVNGPTFSGNIKGMVNANQNTTSGIQHVQNGPHSRQMHTHYYRDGQIESEIEDSSFDEDSSGMEDDIGSSSSGSGSGIQESDDE
ncbi:hypothetical protein F5884DRAFT_487473 [Xylogone sp. PMI_703]|nr:hypothetical protein F5884DRAFT_487473 [Xylogone sp. PMI_703]